MQPFTSITVPAANMAEERAADIVAVLDLDCSHAIQLPHFHRAVDELLIHSRWDVLTANSMPTYYDLCAVPTRRRCLHTTPAPLKSAMVHQPPDSNRHIHQSSVHTAA